MRMIIATIVGILLAFGLINLAGHFSSSLSPAILIPQTNEAEIPAFQTAALFLSWFVGTFAGAWIAIRVSAKRGPGWFVAGAVVGAAISQSLRLNDAIWVTAAGFIIPLAATWLASRAVRITV